MRKIDREAIRKERERIKRRNTLTIVVTLCLIYFCFNQQEIIGQIFFKGFAQAPSAYQALYYYEEDNLARYQSYHATRGSLTAAEVVWRVNMALDRPFYSASEKEEALLPSSTLLVNKYHPLPKGYKPENLTLLSGEDWVTAETNHAYQKMSQEMTKTGLGIVPVTAYRSYEYQEEMYQRMLAQDTQASVDQQIARPGYSEHQTGRTIDIGSSGGTSQFEMTGESQWVEAHGYQYGFIIRYPNGYQEITGYSYEPWHLTYVGVDIATKMKENQITTLEEYVAKYVHHQPE